MAIGRRRFPRVRVDLPAEVVSTSGAAIDVVIIDISSAGFKIECSMAERDFLTPGGECTHAGRPIELEVHIRLPQIDGQCPTVRATCDVVFSRRVAYNKSQVGMKFLRLGNDGFSDLEQYIDMRI